MLLVQVQLAQFPEVVELVDTPDLGSGAVFACSMQVRGLSSGYYADVGPSGEGRGLQIL